MSGYILFHLHLGNFFFTGVHDSRTYWARARDHDAEFTELLGVGVIRVNAPTFPNLPALPAGEKEPNACRLQLCCVLKKRYVKLFRAALVFNMHTTWSALIAYSRRV